MKDSQLIIFYPHGESWETGKTHTQTIRREYIVEILKRDSQGNAIDEQWYKAGTSTIIPYKEVLEMVRQAGDTRTKAKLVFSNYHSKQY